MIYILILFLFVLSFDLIYGSVFVYYPSSMNISPTSPPLVFEAGYNVSCVDISRVSRGALFYTDFESIPSNWHMINGTLTGRGFIGVGGYWSIIDQGFKGRGLRGFPLLWQVREHKTYTPYYPDIRFVQQTTNAIRIDSYTAGASSLGNGYLMLIAPREFFNNTIINTRFNAYFSFTGTRAIGYIDLVNSTIDRRNDTVIFSTYGDCSPYWRKYNTPTYIWLYNVSQAGGPISYNINSTVGDLAGYDLYMTYVITLSDCWIQQTVYFDVFWMALYERSTGSLIYNFSFPYNSYSVVLERSDTYGDYGYLRFGIPGFTASYWGQDISSLTNLWISSKIMIRSGVGFGGIMLTNLSNYYIFSINSSGYANILRYSAGSWALLSYSSVPGYTNSTWYVLVVSYVRSGGTNSFTLYVYDVRGNLLTTITASDTTFTPKYAGLASYTSNLLYIDDVYDDFIVSTSDPRTVIFQNIPESGYMVYIIDNLNNIVNYTTSAGTTVYLGVVNDIVVGTGSDGKISITYPNNFLCINYTVSSSDAILGGDVYSLSYVRYSINIGSNKTSALASNIYISSSSYKISGAIPLKIYNNDVKPYYIRLILDTSSSISSYLTLNITIALSPSATADPIRIVGGSVVAGSSGWISLSGGSYAYIYVTGYYTSSGQSSTLNLYLEYCSLSNENGVCVFYPIQMVINS